MQCREAVGQMGSDQNTVLQHRHSGTPFTQKQTFYIKRPFCRRRLSHSENSHFSPSEIPIVYSFKSTTGEKKNWKKIHFQVFMFLLSFILGKARCITVCQQLKILCSPHVQWNLIPVSCMENYNEVDCFAGKTDYYHCISDNASKLEAPFRVFSPRWRIPQ